ncbi:hypothetical protein KKB18_13595 [bacterium]|nr:hypothetical protein [bacterium]
MKKRGLHPSALIIFSFLILFLLEFFLHLFNIKPKNAPFVTSLPIVPKLAKDLKDNVDEFENPFFEWDRYLLWRGRPHAHGLSQVSPPGTISEVTFNSLGFRSPEVLKDKKEGIVRIVSMGDSTTFGWIVRMEEAYPAMLESLLSVTHPNRFEVINAGIPGYTSFQGKIQLDRVLLDLKPDIVTISFGRNDSYSFKGQIDREEYEFNTSIIGRAKEIFLKSRLYILLEHFIFSLKEKIKPPEEPRKVVRVKLEDFKKNIEEMVNKLKKSNIKVIFINHFWLREDSDYDHSQYNDAFDKIAQKYQIPVLNTMELFETTYNKLVSDEDYKKSMETMFPDILWDCPNHLRIFYPDNIHPTTYGHYVISQALVKIIDNIEK